MKSQIFKLSTGIAGTYHLILGIIALALPVDTVIQVITLAFGMTLEITPQLPLILKFASVYLIAFGGMLLLLTSDPAKYRIFAYPALALFGIRFINRIIFFSTLTAAGVADSRNMMGSGLILVFFLLILCTLPKKQANSWAMHAPEISSDNEILSSLRKRTKEITEGIESEIDELHRLNPYKRSMEFLSFGILYVFGATLAYFSKGNIIMTISGIICMGISLNSLCILIHEGLHGLLAERPWVNHLLSFIVGLPILISATAYQTTHANHHYEIGRKLDYGTYRQHLKYPTLIWLAYFTQLLLGTIVYIACIPFLAYKVANKRSRFFIVAEYCIIIPCAVTVCLIADPASILIYWAYPIVIMSFLTNIRGLASHALGDVENVYLSSRTIKSSKLVSFLFLHENYHLEHHIFPGAPSYSLRKIHELTWKRLPETLYAKSYRQFLINFFQAALKRDLTPMGIVHPIKNLERTPAE